MGCLPEPFAEVRVKLPCKLAWKSQGRKSQKASCALPRPPAMMAVGLFRCASQAPLLPGVKFLRGSIQPIYSAATTDETEQKFPLVRALR